MNNAQIQDLLQKMIKVNQFTNLNILEHGLSVRQQYTNIIKDLNSSNFDEYDFPDKLIDNWSWIKDNLLSDKIMSPYQIYHDCGKPFCLQIDEQGKQHFPNHAEVSHKVFTKYFKDIKHKEKIAFLIKNDMIFHSGSAEEINNFIASTDNKTLWSLWLTSLAELYANKKMFDENNQLSFKIKYKKLTKVLNKIITKCDDRSRLLKMG